MKKLTLWLHNVNYHRLWIFGVCAISGWVMVVLLWALMVLI